MYIFLLFLAVAPLGAQSNQVMDQLLDQPQARFADVVYLTLAAAKIIPDTATPEEAVQSLRQQGWKVSVFPADSPITLGDYSYLLMKAFKVKGGIFYSLFPSPRYACRELGYLKVIPADARPLRSVPGEEAVRILGNMLAFKGGTQ
jgi:hypothetical protein